MIETKRIFLDTAPIIYFVENKPGYVETVADLIAANPEAEYFTSVISITEYLPYPLKQPNRDELIRRFDRFITEAEIAVVDIDRQIATEAARIRAEWPSFKTMDALQLATALAHGCDLFLTNDKQLRQFKAIPCKTMEDI